MTSGPVCGQSQLLRRLYSVSEGQFNGAYQKKYFKLVLEFRQPSVFQPSESFLYLQLSRNLHDFTSGYGQYWLQQRYGNTGKCLALTSSWIYRCLRLCRRFDKRTQHFDGKWGNNRPIDMGFRRRFSFGQWEFTLPSLSNEQQ